ncbi:hypothetical protein ABH935_006453 [Catenulispora sp. GAS73]
MVPWHDAAAILNQSRQDGCAPERYRLPGFPDTDTLSAPGVTP